MPSAGHIVRESTAGQHCLTCTCISHDVSRDAYDCDTTSESENDDISHLDEEIARMNDALTALKRRRNTRLPVTRVPAEILSEIFIYVRDISTLPAATYWKSVPWISIAHVSIRWRSVALDDARLWNTVNLRFPDLVREFSTRCAAMPLHIVLSNPKVLYARDDGAAYEYDHGLSFILDAHNPICSLEMTATGHETKAVLQELLPRGADDLLHIDVALRPTVDELQILQNTFLPTLQTLSLEHVSFKLSSPVLASCAASLRVLKLDRCIISEHSAKPLESLTCLEQFWFSHSTFRCAFPRDTEVNLPNLTKLYLKEDTIIMYTILDVFNCAPSCDVTLCVLDSEIEEWAPLVRYVTSAHPKDAHIYMADGFVELRCKGKYTQYTLKCIYDSVVDHPSELGDIFHDKTTSLSLICDQNVVLNTLYLCIYSHAARRLSSLTVCGSPLVLSLRTCLAEDTDFLPNLSLLHVCDCCADLGDQLLETVHLRQTLEVRIGGIKLCGESHNTLG